MCTPVLLCLQLLQFLPIQCPWNELKIGKKSLRQIKISWSNEIGFGPKAPLAKLKKLQNFRFFPPFPVVLEIYRCFRCMTALLSFFTQYFLVTMEKLIKVQKIYDRRHVFQLFLHSSFQFLTRNSGILKLSWSCSLFQLAYSSDSLLLPSSKLFQKAFPVSTGTPLHFSWIFSCFFYKMSNFLYSPLSIFKTFSCV